MHANIAFAKRAEKRIGDCVQQSVGIRVALAAPITGDVHAAEHQWAALNQLVRIVADADSKHKNQWAVGSGQWQLLVFGFS